MGSLEMTCSEARISGVPAASDERVKVCCIRGCMLWLYRCGWAVRAIVLIPIVARSEIDV